MSVRVQNRCKIFGIVLIQGWLHLSMWRTHYVLSQFWGLPGPPLVASVSWQPTSSSFLSGSVCRGLSDRPGGSGQASFLPITLLSSRGCCRGGEGGRTRPPGAQALIPAQHSSCHNPSVKASYGAHPAPGGGGVAKHRGHVSNL